MKQASLKAIEKKLERKNAELQIALETRKDLEKRIRELKEEIELMQSAKLEHVFQSVKKTILKENLSVTPETVSGMLDALRNSQGEASAMKTEAADATEHAAEYEASVHDEPTEDFSSEAEDTEKRTVPNYEASRLP